MVLAAAERNARKTKEEIIALTPFLSRWEHLHSTPLAYALYLGLAYTRPSRHDVIEGLTGFRYWLSGDDVHFDYLSRGAALLALQGELPEPRDVQLTVGLGR
jgi:hypothetical protein